MQRDIYRDLVYRSNNVNLQEIEDLCNQKKIPRSLLALSYYVHGNIANALTTLEYLEEVEKETLFCMEAMMLIDNSNSKRLEAVSAALQIVNMYPEAAFARYLLASSARKRKNFTEAIKYYEELFQDYPNHPRLPLLIAENYIYLGMHKKASHYIDGCMPSFERSLYKMLAPIALPNMRTTLFVFSLILFIVSAGMGFTFYLFWLFIAILLTTAMFSLLKSKGTLIFSHLIYIIVILITSWGLGIWIWSLLQGG